MIILGLHFGHDANISILKNGIVIAHVIKERHNRIKHAMGLNYELIHKTLDYAGITSNDIDYVALSSTQCHGLTMDSFNNVSVELAPYTDEKVPVPLLHYFNAQNLDIKDYVEDQISSILFSKENSDIHQYLRDMFPEYQKLNKSVFPGFLNNYLPQPGFWDQDLGIDDISNFDFSMHMNNPNTRYSLHYPVKLRLNNTEIPGYFIQHHAAHAASCYYLSGKSKAAILTHDGGSFSAKYRENNGMYFWANDNAILPITPNYLDVGIFYDLAAHSLGFGYHGAGKLMGLAPYGKPEFYDEKLIGNYFDKTRHGIENTWQYFINCMRRRAGDLSYDFSLPGADNNPLSPFNRDLAASVQQIFEDTVLKAANGLKKLLDRHQLNTTTLCLAGGTALNCPTNTRLFNESDFSDICVLPHCDDSGLATGAAQYLYHNVMDYHLIENHCGFRIHSYEGMNYNRQQILTVLKLHSSKLEYIQSSDASNDAAKELFNNKIIAWFYGHSEVGPRSLGHRSILANPGDKQNWQRVNDIKQRESWRPFAPAVLQQEANKWFTGAPSNSPYMLFTAQVRQSAVPAITHVDNTARIQTVTPENGRFYDLLSAFYRLSGIPILLNTSFNGPREPIVETPEDAIRFFLNSQLDYLYVENLKIWKNPAKNIN